MRTRSQLKFVGYWPDGSAPMESFTGTHRCSAAPGCIGDRGAGQFRRRRVARPDRQGAFSRGGNPVARREAYDRETWRPDRDVSG